MFKLFATGAILVTLSVPVFAAQPTGMEAAAVADRCPTPDELGDMRDSMPFFRSILAAEWRAAGKGELASESNNEDSLLGAAYAVCKDRHPKTFRDAVRIALHDTSYFVAEAPPPPKKHDPRSDMLMVSNKSLATGIWYAEAAHACGLRSSEWAGHVKMAMLLQVGIIADRLYPKMHDDDVEYEAHADALQRAWDAQDAAEAEGKNAAPADCKKHLDASDTMALLDKYGDLK